MSGLQVEYGISMRKLLLNSFLLVAISLCAGPLTPTAPVTPTSSIAPAQFAEPSHPVIPSQASATQPPTISPLLTLTPSIEKSLHLPIPPAGYLYHGVYPGGVTGEEDDLTLADLQAYEQAAGKRAAWVYFSHNWYHGRDFPIATATWIRDTGSLPYIRLMLRSDAEQDHAEPVYTLARIIQGDFDLELHAWCRAAAEFGTPVLAEYGTEVNGEWFPWNGAWNGGGKVNGYGDPTQPDGPERFQDTYRHIIQICRDEGAGNLTWLFHVNDSDYPDEPWNTLEAYYPGDEWIDWIGVSVYGAQIPLDDEWPDFTYAMDAVYPRLTALAPDKPIVLLEFGVTSGNPLGQPQDWAEAALSDLTAMRWPRLIGFSWWNETWQNDDDPSHDTDMRVQSNPALIAVFQEHVGTNPYVLDRFVFKTSFLPVILQ